MSYCIELAKSGRAKCKRCKEPIPKDKEKRDDPSFITGWDDMSEEVHEQVTQHYKEGLKRKPVEKKRPKKKKDEDEEDEDDEEESKGKKKAAKGKKKARKDEEDEEEKESSEVDEAVEAKKAELKKKTAQVLKDYCRDHQCPVGGTKPELVERVADAMVHGVLPKCPTCTGGNLHWDKEKNLYRCKGYHEDEGYVPCRAKFEKDEIKRIPWDEAAINKDEYPAASSADAQ